MSYIHYCTLSEMPAAASCGRWIWLCGICHTCWVLAVLATVLLCLPRFSITLPCIRSHVSPQVVHTMEAPCTCVHITLALHCIASIDTCPSGRGMVRAITAMIRPRPGGGLPHMLGEAPMRVLGGSRSMMAFYLQVALVCIICLPTNCVYT